MEDEHTPWQQVNIRFTSPHDAEQAAVAYLRPAAWQVGPGPVAEWWFIRKGDWRLRYLPAGAPAAARDAVSRTLTAMREAGSVDGWTETLYEPETHAFGGPAATEAAHELFYRDSRHILDYLNLPGLDQRREVTVLLCAALIRGAGLDWYEQGDVWARTVTNRPDTGSATPEQLARLQESVGRLLAADPRSGITLASTDADHLAASWLDAFERCGRTLHYLWVDGTLSRGLRAVVTHHLLFHWNRLGIPYTAQGALALAARNTILGV